MKATLYTTDSKMKEVRPKNRKTFSVSEMQYYVHGYFEIIPLGDGCVMIINEEGKIKNLPLNETATAIIKTYYPAMKGEILGDVIVCKKSMIQ